MNQKRELYPHLEPYRIGSLRVSDAHTLYFEESGNPKGKPVVFLHGGPGGGTEPYHRRFFDPSIYRIVLFDQRGCGKSAPHACLEHNTTWDLVEDIEKLRTCLGINRWQVFGGSWGSTLGLAYAQQYPNRVSELVLRGIFLLRPKELSWFYQEGASHIFPDAWEDYLAPIPKQERGNLIQAYYRRLTSKNAQIRNEAAKAWSRWEGSTSFLIPDESFLQKTGEGTFSLAFARIESHYFANGGFFRHPEQLLHNVDRIRDIPSVIIQGRYDVVCPMRSAWDLHNAWPEADFKIMPNAGHSALEHETINALISSTDNFGRS